MHEIRLGSTPQLTLSFSEAHPNHEAGSVKFNRESLGHLFLTGYAFSQCYGSPFIAREFFPAISFLQEANEETERKPFLAKEGVVGESHGSGRPVGRSVAA
jgi:hypothetical protein